MLWLVITIFTYFILAFVFLVDKYLLTASIPNPKVYIFYVGTLGVLILILAPFVGFYVPEIKNIILCLAAGAIFIYVLFWFYKTLKIFEASRVVPVVGGLVPLFTLGLVYLFSFGEETLSFSKIIAFIFLVSGSIIIVLEKEKLINFKCFKNSLLTAILLSFSFVFTKYIFMLLPFWTALIWRSIGGFLMAICFFVFFPEIKKEILEGKKTFSKKTTTIFLLNQTAGAGAGILQSWAIALVPLAYLAFINALQGIQYVFLLMLTVFLSLKFPQILKEEISKKILLQKIIAILLIGGGLALFALE